MDLISWARENPTLVVIFVAIAGLLLVAARMARVPEQTESTQPRRAPVDEARSAAATLPRAATTLSRSAPRTPATRTVTSSVPVASAPGAHRATSPVPGAPAGYVPLEVPELWQPPMGYRGAAAGAAFVHPAAAPPAQTVCVPYTSKTPPATAETPLPRSFADLRRGPLAGREFASLPQFAVAAVVEGGHPVVIVARIFRVPTWKLETWIDEAANAVAEPAHRPWRGTMPRTG